MAVNKTLDPTTCTTAAEAFHYPLPQVRQFHRTLTLSLDEKNARLRTLVGGSYRQLLGTAETILQMREDVGIVEEKLGKVGKGCGRTVVSGKAAGLGKLQSTLRGGSNADQLGWLAKTKVLEMCAVVVGRLLRNGGSKTDGKDGKGKSLIMAAKVLVLSRLLAKSLSDSTISRTKQEVDIVEESRKTLGGLRRKLVRAIERTLEKAGGDENREDLIQAMCAYSLVTSSGAKDVLRHFLHVRGEAMVLAFDDGTKSRREAPGVVKALQLYTRTLLDVQALVPRRLREALENLKKKHLLKDEAIRELEGLRLDVNEKWFGDQILYFTPYNRHDDLDGPLAMETLQGWAKRASSVLLQGFESALQQIPEFKSVVELRTKILELWIKEGGKAKGFDPSVMLDGLRKIINDRMLQLIESRVSKLHLVGTEIEATLQTWKDGVTDRHNTLWDSEMLEMEISNGAHHFKEGVLSRFHGRYEAVSKAVKGYQTWHHLIDELAKTLALLKKQRWDDDLEDIEDDLSIESRSALLSTEDPRILQEYMDTSLEKAYSELDERITALLATHRGSDHIGPISIYTIRIIRDLRSELPNNASIQGFGLSLVPSLHQTLATVTFQKPIQRFGIPFPKKVIGRALWEGNPELPVQPSPRTFRFLHNLTVSMAGVGSDVWSPAAVSFLKQRLHSELGRIWTAALQSLGEEEASEAVEKDSDAGVANGDTEMEPNKVAHSEVKQAIDPEVRKDILTQCLFDIFVLSNALDINHSTTNDLKAIGSSLASQLSLDDPVHTRLESSAQEYWKRTSLLFSLLG